MGNSNAAGSPSRARRSSAAPPGYPRPSSRAPLSNASPAASSSVWPSTSQPRPVVHDPRQQRVAAARDQGEERRLERIGLEQACRDVAVEMVDGRERQLAPPPPEPWPCATPTSSAPTSPGPAVTATRSSSCSDVPAVRSASSTTAPDQLEVVARGDLGDDAAIAVMDSLRGDHVGADLAPVGDHRRAGVVAAGLEREDHPGAPGARGLLGGPPHDHRVLTGVVVVARPGAGGRGTRTARRAGSHRVRCAHLERVRLVRTGAAEHLVEQRGRVAVAAARGIDGDVHQVPHVGVPGADQVTDDRVAAVACRSRPGTRWTASRARARTSPATTASETPGARSRSPAGDRSRRAGGS